MVVPCGDGRMKVFSLIQQAVTRYRKAVAKVSGLGARRGADGEGAGINMALPGDGGGRPGGGERESAAVQRPHLRPRPGPCDRKVLGALGLGRDCHPHSPWTLSRSSGLGSGRLGARSRYRARLSAARGRRGVAWRGASARPTARALAIQLQASSRAGLPRSVGHGTLGGVERVG